MKFWARVRCLVFLTHSVGAKFYCPHALHGSNQHIQISEKMLEFSSTLDSVIYDVSVALSTLLFGRQEEHPACKKTEWYGADMVICLQ